MADRVARILGRALANGDVRLEELAGSDPARLVERLLAEGRLAPDEVGEILAGPGLSGSPPSAARGPETNPLAGRVLGEPLAPGTRVGHYVLETLIGQGGMAQVYRALDPRLRRRVALKILQTADPQASSRFLAEARAQAKLTHENVCRVFEAGDAGGLAYIAMPYVTGGTLEGAADRLSWREALTLMAEVAEALHAAHRAGLVHRDVKPSNILLEETEEGRLRPLVTDFGLVRELAAPGVTVGGAVVGTPEYMAPEQARGEKELVGRAADVWSLGATLYRVLAGVPPFAGIGQLEVMLRVIRDAPEPLARLRPELPRDVNTVVMKCLEKEPARRYESARALAEDLRRVVDEEPIRARPVSALEKGVRVVRRNRALSAVAAAAILLAAGLVGVTLGSRARERRRTELSQRLGRDVAAMEGILRTARLLPLHDTAREKRLVRERMAAIGTRAAALGAEGKGPAAYALGRAHLALGEYGMARTRLEAAREAGISGPEIAWALGQTLGELYRAARVELVRIPQKSLREARRREIDRTLRLPALEALRSARGGEAPPAFLEGLVALYAQRPDEALRLEGEALGKEPGLWEAWRVTAAAWRLHADQARDAGKVPEAAAAFARSREDYERAAAIGRSDASVFLERCQMESDATELEIRRGGDATVPFRAGRAACAAARAADSESAPAFTTDARLVARWAESRMLAGEDPEPWVVEALRLAAEADRREPGGLSALAAAAAAEQARAEYLGRRGLDPRAALGRAIAALERVCEGEPSNPAGFSNLGVQYEIVAEWEAAHGGDPRATLGKAVASYRRAVAARPDFTNAFINLANAERARGDWETAHGLDPRPAYAAAVENALTATRLNPSSPIAFNNLSIAYLGRATFEAQHGGEALASLSSAEGAARGAIAVNPRYAYAWSNLAGALNLRAELLRQTGQDPVPVLEEALASARRRLELDAGSTTGWKAVAHVQVTIARVRLETGGDPAPALEELRRALAKAREVNAGDAEIDLELGRAALLQARAERRRGGSGASGLARARAVLREAEAKNPQSPEIPLVLAEVRLEEALAGGGADAAAAVEDGLAQVAKALAIDASRADALCLRGGLLLARAEKGPRAGREAAAGAASKELREGLRENSFLERDWGPRLARAETLAAGAV